MAGDDSDSSSQYLTPVLARRTSPRRHGQRAQPPPPATTKKAPEPDKNHHKGLQRVCASFALHSCRERTYNETVLKKEIEKRVHGDQNVSSQIEHLLDGKGYYKGLQAKEDVHKTGLSSEELWETVLDEDYNRSNNPIIYGDNLTKEFLQRSTKSRKGSAITGQTLLNYAKVEISEARKIQSCMADAVKAGIVKYTGGYYEYHSGKKKQDLMHFLFFRMHNWDLYYGPSGVASGSDAEAPGEQYKSAWFPKGWYLFWLVGNHPENDPDFQINLSGMDASIEENGKKDGGRNDSRKKEKKEKDAARDYGVANGNEKRGLAYGAASVKDLAVIEQSKRNLDQKEKVGRIAALSTILKSKHDSIASMQNQVDQYMKLDMIDEAKELMATFKDKRDEIAQIEQQMQNLEQEDENKSAHTDQFLQLGAAATRMGESLSGKKRTVDEVNCATESKEDGDEEEEDNDTY